MIPSQMLKGVLEGSVLAIISRQETYGYEISLELERYGFGKITEGTIYPLLLRLEKNGALEAVYRASDVGPKRKYYHLTAAGILYRDSLAKEWIEFQQQVGKYLKEGEQHE